MRELRPDEILTIAGGMPATVVLDECAYRTPAEPLRDPVAFAQLPVDDKATHALD